MPEQVRPDLALFTRLPPDRRHYDIHWNTVVAGDLISMATKKKQTSQVPLVDPPGPLAPIGDWIEHRRDLDRLEAEVRISQPPDQPLLNDLASLKAEADVAIGALIP